MPDQAPGESDEVLVARSRRGDPEAFGELVRRWQRPLFARAMRGVHSVEAADDLVQETFLRAWKGLKQFRDDARFGAWTLRILSNLATCKLRSCAASIPRPRWRPKASSTARARIKFSRWRKPSLRASAAWSAYY